METSIYSILIYAIDNKSGSMFAHLDMLTKTLFLIVFIPWYFSKGIGANPIRYILISLFNLFEDFLELYFHNYADGIQIYIKCSETCSTSQVFHILTLLAILE